MQVTVLGFGDVAVNSIDSLCLGTLATSSVPYHFLNSNTYHSTC